MQHYERRIETVPSKAQNNGTELLDQLLLTKVNSFHYPIDVIDWDKLKTANPKLFHKLKLYKLELEENSN